MSNIVATSMIILLLPLSACSDCGSAKPLRPPQTQPNGAIVSLIVEHEGCRLYEVEGVGPRTIYYVHCLSGEVTTSWDTSHYDASTKTTRIEHHSIPAEVTP